jgi:hypothetical protein
MTSNNNPSPLTLAPEAFDLRTLERFLADGTTNQADYDAYLATLEDSADNAEISSVHMQTHRRIRRVESVSQEEEEGD